MTVQELMDALEKIDIKTSKVIIFEEQNAEYWEIGNILFSKSLIVDGEDEVIIKLNYV
jgi:hypothetical protein